MSDTSNDSGRVKQPAKGATERAVDEAREAADPAVDPTREAAKLVFAKIKSARERAAKKAD